MQNARRVSNKVLLPIRKVRVQKLIREMNVVLAVEHLPQLSDADGWDFLALDVLHVLNILQGRGIEVEGWRKYWDTDCSIDHMREHEFRFLVDHSSIGEDDPFVATEECQASNSGGDDSYHRDDESVSFSPRDQSPHTPQSGSLVPIFDSPSTHPSTPQSIHGSTPFSTPLSTPLSTPPSTPLPSTRSTTSSSPTLYHHTHDAPYAPRTSVVVANTTK